MDIITDYAFGQQYGLLDEDDFNEKWRDTILSIVKSVATIVHLPWLPGLMRALPTPFARSITPDMSQLLDYEHVRLHSCTSRRVKQITDSALPLANSYSNPTSPQPRWSV